MSTPATAPSPTNTGPSKEWMARKDQCDTIELSDVLEKLDADPNQDGDSSKWKLPGLGNILIKNYTWKNVNLEQKGFGAVSLVCHALNIRPGEAVKWIEARWETAGRTMREEDVQAPKEFSPPEPATEKDAVDKVSRYLVHERGLPYSLVQSEMARGAIYATHPLRSTDKTPILSLVNCVFLGTASAELRSTDDDFKGCCDGSDPEISGYRVPHAKGTDEKAIAMTEAAIDGLSYRTLFPGRFTLSTNGAGRFMLPYRVAVEAYENGYSTYLGHDADDAGDIGAQKIFNGFYLRTLLSKRLNVDPSEVDAWLLQDIVRLPVRPVPQDIFFHNGWQESVPEMHEVLVDGPNVQRRWEPTGRQGPLRIGFQVTRHVHPDLPVGAHELPVLESGFNHVTRVMRLRRDRPMHEKDWNAELTRLGSAYIRAYEAAARVQFADGYPALPPALQALRAPGPVVASPLAAAPTPVIPEPAPDNGPAVSRFKRRQNG